MIAARILGTLGAGALALTLLAPAHAVEVASSTRSSTQQNSGVVDQTTRDMSQIWGLTVDEIRRFQLLMRGYRGSVSNPQISPIEVLGIHARDDAERRKYAEMLAKIMVADAERVLAFEREREAAIFRLYPNIKVMDFGKGDGRLQPQPGFGQVPKGER